VLYYLSLVLAGIAYGSVYSLAGMGVVLTYRATGIFNFAHGTIAVFAAYIYWQITGEAYDGGWHQPVIVGAIVAIFLVGPLLGLALEVLVFRPLERSGATTVEKLVATVGVFVLLLGIVVQIWTFRVRTIKATLFPQTTIHLHGNELTIGVDQLMTVVLVAVICVAIYLLFQRTHLGTEIRAVVDRRELAQLAAVDADRVSAIAWVMGTTLSAFTGVLLASLNTTLNPYDLALFVIETFSIAVVARLRSFPLAVLAGIGLLGVLQSLLKDDLFQVFHGRGTIGETFNNLKPNLSVVVLFVFLLAYRRLDDSADEGTTVRSHGVSPPNPRRLVPLAGVTALVLIVLPFRLDFAGFQHAHQMLAFMVIFASIVAVTGFSGQITLGQAGFAGLGAFASARIGTEFGLPVIVAMVLGGLVAMVAGILVGYPALRRRGLFLGLVTLAVGLLLDRFVFQSNQFAGTNGLQVTRPVFLGIDLDSDKAFYFFELVVLGLMLGLTRNLRSGRLGRALAAMRDSEDGARSIGLNLRSYKLFIFGVSAFMAGIGGAMLTQQGKAFSFQTFVSLNSLFWFAAVVVAGVSSVYGAVLAGFLYVGLDIVVGQDGASQALIGLAALVLGLLPGRSLLGLFRHLADRLDASWIRYRDAAVERATLAANPVRYEPSPLARAALGLGPVDGAAPATGNGQARPSTRREPLRAARRSTS
jgi:branched-chain amino acid transport system permease protein